MDTSTKHENRRYFMIWILALNKRIEDIYVEFTESEIVMNLQTVLYYYN